MWATAFGALALRRESHVSHRAIGGDTSLSECSAVEQDAGTLPHGPFNETWRQCALWRSSPARAEGSRVDLEFKADSGEGVAVQTQGRRGLAQVSLILAKRSTDECLPELRESLPVGDAASVHLYYERLQNVLHGSLAGSE